MVLVITVNPAFTFDVNVMWVVVKFAQTKLQATVLYDAMSAFK